MASVSIYMDGEDRTAQIRDWSIVWSHQQADFQLKCVFPSGKSYSRPLSVCSIVPTRELGEMLLTTQGSRIVQRIESAIIYGERYACVQYPTSTKRYLFKLADITLMPPTSMTEMPVFLYFAQVANARIAQATSADGREIAANVVRQLEQVNLSPETALYAYCTGYNQIRPLASNLIYPFGVNASQLKAVEHALSSQISVIEGPPGTGKTQTILNILANLLMRQQTVAVLSNNNAAVANVYEKLEKANLGHLIAKLGNQQNRESFFADLPPWPGEVPKPAPDFLELQRKLAKLKQLLHAHNTAAQLQAEVDELTTERRYLQQWQAENGIPSSIPLDKYGLSPSKIADLLAYLAYLGEQRIRLRDRIELLLNFGIFRTRPMAQETRLPFFHTLQLHYYDTVLRGKEAALQACRESLAQANFTALMEELSTGSMLTLKSHLNRPPDPADFNEKYYKRRFDNFLRRFPIIGSSSHSIVNSIAPGAVLDYIIIDEASQQDIVPGILALACAKNLIVVGDSRQLAHIANPLDLPAPDAAYDCMQLSLLDSCIAVFKDSVPRTLLREHYRCHPRIIQFCNQQFYDNALIPMTEDHGEAPWRLVVTAKGNHTRSYTNQRELDSLLKILEDEGEPAGLDGEGRGFMAPYRAQVSLSNNYLPAHFVKDTVHKFQGRECDEMVFSTVLDKKHISPEQMDFVDNPRMINVAVSRARKRFTLVTGDNVFSGRNGHIAALMRYIEYYTPAEQVARAPVVSAFDLLYREYDQSLERLNARLRPEDSRYKSEQIVAEILRQALADASCKGLTFHTQILLNQIVATINPALTSRERDFLQHRASCDFVLYFTVGKTPLGVIEVDGSSHDQPKQRERDQLKDSILRKSNLALLRLRTVESGIEEKVAAFLAQWARTTKAVTTERT